jgi:hypothetical protein
MENDWSDDIENLLENIRINCVIYSKEYKKHFFYLKNCLQYFRLPIIILSGINSIISVGIQSYLKQSNISIITCLLSLSCSIIGSVELYLAVQKSMENCLIAQRDFYLLSVDIFKTLSLKKEHRPIPAKEYLDKQFNCYCKLIESSDTIKKIIKDKLQIVDDLSIINKTTNLIEDKLEIMDYDFGIGINIDDDENNNNNNITK